MTSTDDTDAIINRLTGDKPLRVWSLIVTIFGDMAPGKDDWLSGATLGQLTAPLGVRPEALRVALHRLRKDGWIESRRNGRVSTHRLSAMGRAEREIAAPQIYEHTPPETLWLVLSDPQVAAQDGPVWIGQGVGLSALPVADFCHSVEPAQLPDWMRARTVSPDLVAECARVAEGLARLGQHISGKDRPDPNDLVPLRILAVHVWRRIALKTPDLPDAALPVDWRGAEARQAFKSVLDQIPKGP